MALCSKDMATVGTIRPCFSKAFSRSRATGWTIRRCYSGIISSPPLPLLPVEELKNRHGLGPWLMFADAENDKRGGEGLRRCYSFASGEIFSLPAPQLQGRRCWGTQYGWLITFGPRGVVHLFNPLTHHQLPLPSRRSFLRSDVSDDRLVFFDKFSLSSNPSDSDPLVVMSSYHQFRRLAFSSPGDKAWKYRLKDYIDPVELAINTDTIFYRGQFYSIDSLGKLKVCDITSGEPKEKPITPTFPLTTDKVYLVEIGGYLHLICRAYVYCPDIGTIKTRSFDIYKIDFREANWFPMDDLGGNSLFLGNNTTFAISATDYPGIKHNCIYFSDDITENYDPRFCDMGVYDFANKTLVDPFIKGDD